MHVQSLFQRALDLNRWKADICPHVISFKGEERGQHNRGNYSAIKAKWEGGLSLVYPLEMHFVFVFSHLAKVFIRAGQRRKTAMFLPMLVCYEKNKE